MNKIINILSLPLLLLFSGCSQNGYEEDTSIRLARVGSHYLTLQEARSNIPDFALEQDSVKALKKYREEWIQEKLLLQKAVNLQLTEQETVQQRLQKARQEVLTSAVRELVFSEFKTNTEISDQEALQYYKNHKEQFVLQQRYVRFRHVSSKNIEFIRAARQELLSGTPWPKVARLYSEEAGQRIQQSQQFWPQSLVLNDLPIMKQYITTLDSSEVSSIRRRRGMYHFVQLTGARAAGEYAKPQWIMDRLKNWMMLEKQQQFFKSYLKNLYLEAMQHNEIELYNVLTRNIQTKTDSLN